VVHLNGSYGESILSINGEDKQKGAIFYTEMIAQLSPKFSIAATYKNTS
jgi:hypothetical protein